MNMINELMGNSNINPTSWYIKNIAQIKKIINVFLNDLDRICTKFEVI
jgi:hypothetical protein